MSFDALQSAVRRTKCPLALELDGRLPESLRPDDPTDTARLCHVLEEYARAMIDTLSPSVPALLLPLARYQALGWQGIALWERLAAHGREQGMFVIAHPLQSAVGDAGGESALYFLSHAHALTVNGYPGSGAILPALEQARQTDGCLFLLLRDMEGGEVQDLVAGGRQLYQVLADLALRLERSSPEPRIGVMFGSAYPSDLRALRKRMPKAFFLLPHLPVEDTLPAFDQYGRGALVTLSVDRPMLPQQALEQVQQLRQEYRRHVPFL